MFHIIFCESRVQFYCFMWIAIVPASFIDQQYQFSHKSNSCICISHFRKLRIRSLRELKSCNLVWSLKQESELRLEWNPCLHPPCQHFPHCVMQSYSSLSWTWVMLLFEEAYAIFFFSTSNTDDLQYYMLQVYNIMIHNF